MLKRLPSDNFPDDTETSAFQNYSEDTVLQRRLWARRWMVNAAALLIVLVIVGVGGYALFWRDDNEPEITTIVVPHSSPTPSPSPLQLLGPDFPVDGVEQQAISIPARIEDSLFTGGRRGYAWYASEGVSWQISVWGQDTFDPFLQLYGPPGGGVLMEDSAADDGVAEIVIRFDQAGVYALLIEATTGGSYTLSILPIG